ncbi:dTMP kinase [Candidatus Sumerlaeota bacterium]|nr:dTMP kinase [Candidatus Sumerlaeota bacterium]
MAKRLDRGRLIVVEGIDGSGKTTQCRRVVARLVADGWDVLRLREPTDGPHGTRIRELARSGRDGVSVEEEMDLFVRDREENVRANIRPALDRGAVVVMDRYYYSTIAYQGARGLDPARVRVENERFAPAADLLVILDLPVETACRRIEASRSGELDLFERRDYLEKVKAIFDAMPDPQIVRIDATQEPDAVFAAIWEAVETRLGLGER